MKIIFSFIIILSLSLINFTIAVAESAEDFINKGNTLSREGKYGEAIKCYEKAIEINPDDADVLYNMGTAYFFLGKYEDAIKWYDRVLILTPQDGEAMYSKGTCFFHLDKYEEALEWYDKALEISPGLAKIWNDKGTAFMKLKNYEEALGCYEKAIEIDPSYSIAKVNRDDVLKVMEGANINKDAKILLKIVEPVDMKNIKTSGVHITGLATSNNGIVKVLIEGSEAVISEVSEKYKPLMPREGKTVQFDGEALLSLGDNRIKIVAVDKGNFKKEEFLAIHREEDINTAYAGIEIKKPFGGIIKTPESRITLEGMVYTKKGIGLFEIYGVTGENKDKADWTEKGPKATGKTEYYFSKDVELKAGINFIVLRMVDNGGKEVKKEIKVVYEPKEGEKWAVVIGIGKYENPKVKTLEYSDKDAKSIYDYLVTKGGFAKDHVKLLLNEEATLKNVKTALGKFLQEKAMKDDLVFIYYSGHGAPEINPHSKDSDGLSKYIITCDADPDNLFATALPMEDIGTIFGRIISKKIVFFIDSCYSGAGGGKTFSGSGIKAGNISDKFLNDLSSGRGRLIITASSANEVALESKDLGHGIFTYYLLQGLAGGGDLNKNGFVTADELYQYLYEKVSKDSDNRQHPSKKGESEGDILLVKSENN